ncbi:hypothetical protein [Helicobacter cetorum]|uniref:hypothetical protein n=1 Tax=Helicobacter cetorum TaxID=138563 RepID=UPI000CF11B6F|nr:hypothetical protein [Helicobacter cetorum]
MPKIHNYSQNLVARSYHNKQPKMTVENNQKELTNSLETTPTNELAQRIKSDNIAIGNLQKRLKDLTSMHKDMEGLVSFSKDFSQNLQTERESIQNALNQWKKELSKAISSTKYDTLDRNSLDFEKFQNAHNIDKITPSRLQELLA